MGDIGYSTCVTRAQSMTKRQKWGGGGLSAQFSGIIILNLKVYLGDQLCSKYTKKSFVSYSGNEI